jgi:hypothetical protein
MLSFPHKFNLCHLCNAVTITEKVVECSRPVDSRLYHRLNQLVQKTLYVISGLLLAAWADLGASLSGGHMDPQLSSKMSL